MSQMGDQQEKNLALRSLNITLLIVTGAGGCVTVLIILAAMGVGLWLDRRFDSRPWITVGLMIASVPLTLVAMYWVARKTTARFSPDRGKQPEKLEEEANRGKTS
jgi:hypothetical protein